VNQVARNPENNTQSVRRTAKIILYLLAQAGSGRDLPIFEAAPMRRGAPGDA